MLPTTPSNGRVSFHVNLIPPDQKPKKNGTYYSIDSARDQFIAKAMESGCIDAGGQVIFPYEGPLVLDELAQVEIKARMNEQDNEGPIAWNLYTFLQYVVPYFRTKFKESTVTIGQGALDTVGRSFFSRALSQTIDSKTIPEECWNFCSSRSHCLEIWISLNQQCSEVQLESLQNLIEQLIATQALDTPPPDLLNALTRKNSAEVIQILERLNPHIHKIAFSSVSPAFVEVVISPRNRVKIILIPAGVPASSYLLDHFQLGIMHRNQKLEFSLVSPNMWQCLFDQLIHRLVPAGINYSAEWALGRYWAHLTRRGAVFQSDILEQQFPHAAHDLALINGLSEMRCEGDALLAYYCNASCIHKTPFDLTAIQSETPMGNLLCQYSSSTIVPILQLVGIFMTGSHSTNRDAPVCQKVYGKLQISWNSHNIVLPYDMGGALEKINVDDPGTLEALTKALMLFSPVPHDLPTSAFEVKHAKILDALRSHSPRAALLFMFLSQHVEKMDVLELPHQIGDAVDSGDLETTLNSLDKIYQRSPFAAQFNAVKKQLLGLVERSREACEQAALEPLLMNTDSQIASKAWALSIPKRMVFLEKSIPVMKKEALSYALGYVCQHVPRENITVFAICLNRLLIQNPPFAFTSTYAPKLYDVLMPYLSDPVLDGYPRVKAVLVTHALEDSEVSLDRLKLIEGLICKEEEWARFDAVLVNVLGYHQTHEHFESLCHGFIARSIARNDATTLRSAARWEKVVSLELLTYLTTRREGITADDVASVHRLHRAIQPTVEQVPSLCDFIVGYYRSQSAAAIATDLEMSFPYFIASEDNRLLDVFVTLAKSLHLQGKNKRYKAQFRDLMGRLEHMEQDPRYVAAVCTAFPSLDQPSETVCAFVAKRAFETRNDVLLLQSIKIAKSKELENRFLPACVMRHMSEQTPFHDWNTVLKAFQNTGAYRSVDRSIIIQLLRYLTENSVKSNGSVNFFCEAVKPDITEVPGLLSRKYLETLIHLVKQEFVHLKDRNIFDQIFKVLKSEPADPAVWSKFVPLFRMMVESDLFLPAALDILVDPCTSIECLQLPIPRLCERLGEAAQTRAAVAYGVALSRATPQQSKLIHKALPSLEWLNRHILREETFPLVVELFVHTPNRDVNRAEWIATRLCRGTDSPLARKFVERLAQFPSSCLDKDKWIPLLKSLILKNQSYHILFPQLIELTKPFAAPLYVRCQKLHAAGKIDEVRDLFNTENPEALTKKVIKLLKVPRISEEDIQLAFALFDNFNPTLFRSFLVNHALEIIQVLQGESKTAVAVLFVKMGTVTCRDEHPDTIVDTLRVLHKLYNRKLHLLPKEQADLNFMFARTSDPVLHESGAGWISGCICAVYLFSSLETDDNFRLYKKYAESPFVPKNLDHQMTYLKWIAKCFMTHRTKVDWREICRMVQVLCQFDIARLAPQKPTPLFLTGYQIWQTVAQGPDTNNLIPVEFSEIFTDTTIRMIDQIVRLFVDSHSRRVWLNDLRDTVRRQKNNFLQPDHEAKILVKLQTYVFSFDTPERAICSLQDFMSCKDYFASHSDEDCQIAVSMMITAMPHILQRCAGNTTVVKLIQSSIEMLMNMPWFMDLPLKDNSPCFEELARAVAIAPQPAGCNVAIVQRLQNNPALALRVCNALSDQEWARLIDSVPGTIPFAIFHELLITGTSGLEPPASILYFMAAGRVATHLMLDNSVVLNTLSNIVCLLPVYLWNNLPMENRVLLYARWTAALCNISKLLKTQNIVRADLIHKKVSLATELTRLALGLMTDVEGCKKFSDILAKLPLDQETQEAILKEFNIPLGAPKEVVTRLTILKQVIGSQKFK